MYDSGLDILIIKYELNQNQNCLRNKPIKSRKLKSWTDEWMVRRINDQPLDIGCEILKYMQEKDKTRSRQRVNQITQWNNGSESIMVY